MTNDENMTACPKCGQPTSIELARCPHCNFHIAAEQPQDAENAVVATRELLKAEKEVPSAIHCHGCGAEFSAFVDKCPKCGQHTHHESHFEDRQRGLLRWPGRRMLFFFACGVVGLLLFGWLLLSIGPETPP